MRAPHFRYENQMIKLGHRHVAGVDEVGRGPLAGPVTAAAVILDPKRRPKGLADSKALSAAHRLALFDDILGSALAIGIGMASAVEIDAINIRQATFLAMRRALNALSVKADFALIDGNSLPPDLACSARAIVKGDAQSVSISAASIVAKVTRDKLMAQLHESYPVYGFEQNAGYPTKFHREALSKYGACPFHRLSFGPLKTLIS